MSNALESYGVIQQGEKVLAAATEQLVTESTPCKAIWFGAPTTAHTVGAVNTDPVLIGKESGGNESGGQALMPDDHRGFLLTIDDASKVYLTGTVGHAIEYQILER